METIEMVAVGALILALLLLIKVFSLQSRINDIQSDLEWLKGRAEGTVVNRLKPAADPRPLQPASAQNSLLDERVQHLLARGDKIKAIKLVRAEQGIGLKEAKDYVENLERR
ncbi:ribosomal protein L7/L12 [Paenibacillus sp. UNC499MF]|uniref:ribosomal protein L7/L12 n=1 Tax=Paenibacillus sp. UNC499MF TaxID=1502751 RepID=UPI0008A0987C|nr:ribosomal protein L7/L12 [Paenibacillus sp. UNC499MF]SEG68497.1 large subunit ribosomal protein L7/L12 [Paenibacillus sp. UNC499MF]